MNSRPKLLLVLLIGLIGLATAGWYWLDPFQFGLIEETTAPTELAESDTIKIEVTHSGLVRLNPELLTSKGLIIDEWDTSSLAVTSLGSPVPIYIDGEDLIFFGRESDTKYSSFRPYFLHMTADPEHRVLMNSRTPPAESDSPVKTVTKTLKLEENLVYTSTAYDDAFPDTWYWETIHVQKSFEFDHILTDVADGSGQLKIHLYGQSHDALIENDHDIDLVINGQPITTIVWDGPVHHVAEIDLPAGTLINGANQFLLDNRPAGSAFIDIMLLDWVEITYAAEPTAHDDAIIFKTEGGAFALSGFTGRPLAFDVSNPDAPVFLDGGSFEDGRLSLALENPATVAALGPAAPQVNGALDLKKTEGEIPSDQGDLIVIAADELLAVLEPYIEYRTGQGLRVVTVTPDILYDQYAAGLPSPEAFQAYLADAWENWASPPRYVLLIGPARYDFQDNLDLLPKNHLPSMMVPVTHSGETVSDNRIADVNGDYLPDIAIGRWPVSTPEEVSDVAARTIAYERGLAAEQAIFAADGTSPEFTGLSDHLATTSGLANTNKLYGVTPESVAESWNSGSWLVSYVGHGSIRLWGKESLFSDQAIDLLTSSDTFSPPIVAQFTCLTGYYAHPTQRSLSEQLITRPGGPVLVLGATSLTYSTHQRPFAERFLQGLKDPAFERIGDVLLFARADLDLNNEGVREVSDTFGLLGDPSAIIVRPSKSGS